MSEMGGKRTFFDYAAAMQVLRRSTVSLAMLAFAINFGSRASAQEAEADGCFDLEVSASITAQVPTVLQPSDDGSLVLNWPWFVDLKLKQARGDGIASGQITVLALQHTYYRSDLGLRRWRLRRNDRGGFNLLGLADSEIGIRCAIGAPPAVAYIRLPAGEALDKLRLQGEKRYARHSS